MSSKQSQVEAVENTISEGEAEAVAEAKIPTAENLAVLIKSAPAAMEITGRVTDALRLDRNGTTARKKSF